MGSLSILSAFAAMLIVSGCATTTVVQKPSEAEIRDVEEGKAAVVLLQIRSMIDGKIDRAVVDSNRNIRLYIANVDKRQPPERLTALKTPSKESAADGWAYLTLPPGTYYLLILPPGVEQNPPAAAFHAASARYGRLAQYKFEPGRGGFWSPNSAAFILPGARPEDFREIPGYWFAVPPKRPVIYLGSISVNCSSGKGLFGDLIDTCSDFSLSSASDDAARMARVAFPNLGSVHESTMVPYGKPAKLARPLFGMPIAFSAVPPSRFSPAEFLASPASPTGVVHSVSREISIFNLLALAAGEISRSTARTEAQRRSLEIQPCVEKLSRQLQALDVAGLFSRAIAGALQSGGVRLHIDGQGRPVPPATGDQLPYSLTATTERVLLRECGNPAELCLELGMRLRVLEQSSGNIVYDSTLLYSNDFLPLDPLQHGSHLYERLAGRRSPCVHLGSWCGDGGAAMLQEQLNTGAMEIAAQFIRDISLP